MKRASTKVYSLVLVALGLGLAGMALHVGGLSARAQPYPGYNCNPYVSGWCDDCSTTMGSFYCDNGNPPWPLASGDCFEMAGSCTNWIGWFCGHARDCVTHKLIGVDCNGYDFCSS